MWRWWWVDRSGVNLPSLASPCDTWRGSFPINSMQPPITMSWWLALQRTDCEDWSTLSVFHFYFEEWVHRSRVNCQQVAGLKHAKLWKMSQQILVDIWYIYYKQNNSLDLPCLKLSDIAPYPWTHQFDYFPNKVCVISIILVLVLLDRFSFNRLQVITYQVSLSSEVILDWWHEFTYSA